MIAQHVLNWIFVPLHTATIYCPVGLQASLCGLREPPTSVWVSLVISFAFYAPFKSIGLSPPPPLPPPPPSINASLSLWISFPPFHSQFDCLLHRSFWVLSSQSIIHRRTTLACRGTRRIVQILCSICAVLRLPSAEHLRWKQGVMQKTFYDQN